MYTNTSKPREIKTAILFLLFCLSSCHDKQKEITKILTNDSVQYWNIADSNDPRPFYHNSYSFSKDGICEKYNVDILDKRSIKFYDTVPDERGECNKWRFINDSIIYMLGSKVKIVSYSKDSIILGSGRFRLYRVIGPFRVDPKSIKERDSLITVYAKYRALNKDSGSDSDSAAVMILPNGKIINYTKPNKSGVK
jgi:hypothetical protein